MTEGLKKLPTFETPEEEDEFWQTHSPLDYEHEPVDTGKRAFRYPTMKNLTLRLDEETLRSLQEAAKSTGVRPTALARDFIRRGVRSRPRRRRADQTTR